MSPLSHLQQQPRPIGRVVRAAQRATDAVRELVGHDEQVVDWQRIVERDRPRRLREAPRGR